MARLRKHAWNEQSTSPRPSAAASGKPFVVIVMPAYNAAKTLEDTFRRDPRRATTTRSSSWTTTAATTPPRSPSSLNLKAIRHPHNVGYGGNQKTCYMEALRDGADIVVMLHPDGQYDPAIIPEMIRPIQEGRADMVLGLAHDDPGRRGAGRDAALEAGRQPLPHHRGEPGHGPAVLRVPHRVSRLQPALPGDGALPAQRQRVRVRHRGHLPGRALRPAGGRGADLDPLLRGRVVGRLPRRRRLRPRHAGHRRPVPAAPVGDHLVREVPAPDAAGHVERARRRSRRLRVDRDPRRRPRVRRPGASAVAVGGGPADRGRCCGRGWGSGA